MKPSKSTIASAAAAVLALTTTTALAGSGVGGVFNLGQVNTVDAQTTLSGNAGGSPELKVTTAGAGAAVRGEGSNGIGVNGISVSGTGQQGVSTTGIGMLGTHSDTAGINPGVQGGTNSTDPKAAGVVGKNNGGGPGLKAIVNAGAPPLLVTSSAKVLSLNVDLLDGLDSTAFQKRVTGTCGAGQAIKVVNADGSVACEPVGIAGAWGLTGNSSTTPGTNFLGTTDNQALDLKVNGQRALRLQPTSGTPNVIGGYAGNITSVGVVGATIAGGGGGSIGTENTVIGGLGTVGGGWENQAGGSATVAGGQANFATGNYSAAGGGFSNSAGGNSATVAGGNGNTASSEFSTVGGGEVNTAAGLDGTVAGGTANVASGDYSTVGGGNHNTVASADPLFPAAFSTVGGGQHNTASGPNATVGGGSGNQANFEEATIGGGYANKASGQYEGATTVGGGRENVASGDYSTVAGGNQSTASGTEATVAGGSQNTASGAVATVAGGFSNTAGGLVSFAAGQRAQATQDGSFVWGDHQDVDVSAPAANTFTVRASGGIWLGTTSSPAITAGHFIDTSTGAYLSSAGAWTNSSDRALKDDLRPLDKRSLLDKVARMPITSWSYKAEKPSVRHIGPMAQDFYKAFGLGLDDKHISTIDEGGVALAAIQGLYHENQRVRRENLELERTNAGLSTRLGRLEQTVKKLGHALQTRQQASEGGADR